jgi:replicative DNA helicase
VAVVHPIEDARQIQRDARPHLRSAGDNLIQIGDAVDPWENDQRRFRLGLANIDASMKPRRAGDFTVVGALPGGGKTSILEQSAVANARDGLRVVVYSLEMTVADLQAKMIGREMGVDFETFEAHRVRQSAEYLAAVAKLRALPLKMFRPPEGQIVNIQQIFGIAERARADMLAIDYAALIGGWEPGNKAREILHYCAAKTKETGIYLLLLAQLDQRVMLRKQARPMLADFEDSKAFAKTATGVILIHRPFNGDPKRDTVAEIIVAKNRKLAPTFKAHVFWNGPTTSFFTMSTEEEAACACCKPKAKAKPAPRGPNEMTRNEEDALLDEARSLFP